MLKIGIIGLPLCGKTTIFDLLTGRKIAVGKHTAVTEAHLGVVSVPDKRLTKLAELFAPRKPIYATVEFIDIAPLTAPIDKKDRTEESRLASLRNVDAFLHIVRLFKSEIVPHPLGEINPVRDIEEVHTELILTDLAIIEKRLERISHTLIKESKSAKEIALKEKSLLERLKAQLETGKFISSLSLSEEEEKQIKGYCFLTAKPVLLVGNIDEEQIGKLEDISVRSFIEEATKLGLPYQIICGKTELELEQLSSEESMEFRRALGLDTEVSAKEKLIKNAYYTAGMISFFTVGTDEVKAWSIKKGTKAVTAAGVIHSDFEKGFIKAEVIPFDELLSIGSFAEAKNKGVLRLEGKEYIIQDGDVITYRFHV